MLANKLERRRRQRRSPLLLQSQQLLPQNGAFRWPRRRVVVDEPTHATTTITLILVYNLFRPHHLIIIIFFLFGLSKADLFELLGMLRLPKGSSFPSKKSSSAVNMAWLLTFLERNSKSATLALSFSFWASISSF
ncbi:hypothetical protein F3Y22_tig00013960pilonHSYRG00374 [Hibiscus syriacus]|uniref:Uncharacterized protein n=1 Tax=Hibiscus syriacus TaxID=106335 RepID=A0A6A3C0L2_HIBSY|nr:hypothetical protein F3Y22_tig00013960pilonHSYRG00374 [Hibiscus syriacus]